VKCNVPAIARAQRANRGGAPLVDLEGEQTAGLEQRGRARKERAGGVETVRAAHQCFARLVTGDRRIQVFVFRGRQVGGFDTIARNRSPVSISGASRFPARISTGVLGATRFRFSARAPRGSRLLDRDDSLELAFAGERQRNAAAARSDVRGQSARAPREDELHEAFSFRRGISARRSILRSSVRNPAEPTA